MDSKNKTNIDALWAKYQKTLEMLDDALERLEQKPKEVLKEVEKIVEVEKVVEVPVTEWVEVPVEKIKDISDEERRKYLDRIAELEQEVKNLRDNKGYWGKPKTSKKIIDDMTYEQQTEQRYQRLVKEVKARKLDINLLSDQEQIIVQRIIDNE
jgi:proline dehydrogenase